MICAVCHRPCDSSTTKAPAVLLVDTVPPALQAIEVVHEIALIKTSTLDPRMGGLRSASGAPHSIRIGFDGIVANVNAKDAVNKVAVTTTTKSHRRF